MSLFKICDWWSIQCPDINENYDSFNIIVTRFGLREQEKDYVVVGSHSGHLSIFYPNVDKSKNPSIGFKPVDLLLECKLGFPILMLSAGKFSTIQNRNQLAVLHPNSLVIYNFVNTDGLAEHGSQYNIQQICEYKFELSAFSICTGKFGQVKDKEFLCVVHLNGSLTFYEQEGISYQCNTSGSKSLPSIVLYNERTDSFISVNSSWEMECYSYQDLSHSTINSKVVLPSWSVLLGEYILDMTIVQTEENMSCIMVLGERNLINVSDIGVVNFLLKLDFIPKCFNSFLVGYYWDKENPARLITSIISENSTLVIYEESKLIWAAQLEDSQIAVKRGNFEDLAGGIVFLSNCGFLQIGYLGSEPFIFQVPQFNLQELNFESSHLELAALENEIKTTIDSDDIKLINSQAESDLEILEFSISSNLQANTFESIDEEIQGKNLMMCSGYLKVFNRIALDEMQIYFNTPEGVGCSNSCQTFTDVLEKRMESMEVWFFLNEKLNTSYTKIEVIISFISKEGIPRVVKRNAHMPLTMFYKAVPGQKESSLKLTFKINKKSGVSNIVQNQPPALSEIFPEFYKKDSMNTNFLNDSQVIGLSSVLWPSKIVTVITAKNSNRLRVQTNFIEALPPIVEKIIYYIKNLQTSKENEFMESDMGKMLKKESRILTNGSQISPTSIVIEKIQNHHDIQNNISNQTIKMDSLWLQFKLFQRSLQSKKDNDEVDGVLMLIEKNYDDLVVEGDKLVELRSAEKSIRNELTCSITVCKQIIRQLNLDVNILNLLKSTFVTPIDDWSECSWEESISPGLEALYNAITEKTNISATKLSVSVPEKFDYKKLKKHLLSVLNFVFNKEDIQTDIN